MTLREAAEKALEALEAHADFGVKADRAIDALRAALAEPDEIAAAAAPEMLEALQKIVAMWDHHCAAHGDGIPSPLHAKARAAIAKATGVEA